MLQIIKKQTFQVINSIQNGECIVMARYRQTDEIVKLMNNPNYHPQHQHHRTR